MTQYKLFYLYLLSLVISGFINSNLIAPPMFRAHQESNTSSDSASQDINSTSANIPTSSTPDTVPVEANNTNFSIIDVDKLITVVPDFTVDKISVSDIYKFTNIIPSPYEKIINEYREVYKAREEEFEAKQEEFNRLYEIVSYNSDVIFIVPRQIENADTALDNENNLKNTEVDNNKFTNEKFQFPEYVERLEDHAAHSRENNNQYEYPNNSESNLSAKDIIAQLSDNEFIQRYINSWNFRNFDGVEERMLDLIKSNKWTDINGLLRVLNSNERLRYLPVISKQFENTDACQHLDTIYLDEYSKAIKWSDFRSWFSGIPDDLKKNIINWFKDYNKHLEEIRQDQEKLKAVLKKTHENIDYRQALILRIAHNILRSPKYNARFDKTLKQLLGKEFNKIRNITLTAVLHEYDNNINISLNKQRIANYDSCSDIMNKHFPVQDDKKLSEQYNAIRDITFRINNSNLTDKAAGFLDNLGIQNRLEKIKNISFGKLVKKVVERSADHLDNIINNLCGKEQEVKTEVFKNFVKSTLNLIQNKAELGFYECALEIIQIHENGSKFIAGVGCEIAAQFWSKIVDSHYETTIMVGIGLAGTVIIPVIAAKIGVIGTAAAVVAGASGVYCLASQCCQKYGKLKEHLQISNSLIASGNNFDAGREVIKGLKAGGELDILLDAVILGISSRAIKGINTLATSAIEFGIENDYKAAIAILEKYQYSKGIANEFKNIGAGLINYHTKDIQLIVKTTVDLTAKHIKDSIRHVANIATKCKQTGASILSNEIVAEIVEAAEQTIKIILGDATEATKDVAEAIAKSCVKTLDKIIKITAADVPDLTIDLKNKFSESTNKWIIDNKFEPNKFKDFIKMFRAGGVDAAVEKGIIAEIAQANHELAALCREHGVTFRFDFFHLIGLDKKNGLHTECVISKMPDSQIKVVPIQQFPGGTYEADVFLNGIKLESRTFTPKSMDFQAIKESMFECIRKIDFNKPIDSNSGKIIQDLSTKYGFKVRVVIQPNIEIVNGVKFQKIETFTPIRPE